MSTLSMVAQPCPSDDQLLAFAEGLLAGSARGAVEAHLGGCADCSAVVGATYRSPESPERTLVGRYEVCEELGRGGMGRVLRARDPSLARDVAIKLILPAALSPGARERFAREAMTLGKLRHPSVLEVFDVGESEEGPFFVMEFIEGQNLDAWSRGRTPAAVLECLRGAGRGLAAAHGEGILHRDFKPSNVIVGPNGRAKVADFGLAGYALALTDPASGGAPVDSLTKTGAVMGTLSYMAPELLDGGKATAASDQFAFCVTMYEVLYGSRPFRGADARALSAAIRGGALQPAPSEIVLPRRARQALVRGFAPDPADRFPSMEALLHELRPTKRPLAKLGVGLTVASGLVAAGVLGLRDPHPSACAAFGAGLDGVYDSRARAAVLTAFRESELPYAQDASRSTVEGLDAYAEQWMTGARGSCVASERGELSGDELDLQMRCFKQAERRLGAMVELLEVPARTHVERGRELVATLPDLRLCSDLEALRGFTVLPANASEAAEAETLDPILSQAHAKTLVKDFDGALELLQRHSAAFDAATYPPVRVRVLRVRARVRMDRQDLDGAQELSLRAHELAVEHRLDRDASRTATFLGEIASRKGETERAERWYDVALALAEAGGFHQLLAFTYASASQLYEQSGDLDRGVEAAARAVALIRDDPSYPATSRADVLLTYSDRLFGRGGGDDGLAQLHEAQRILVSLHGDSHPSLGDVARALQVRASRRGDYQASFEHGREALRITRATEGEGSLRVVAATANVGIALKELGRYEDAEREFRRADKLLDAWPKYREAMRIPILSNLGNVFVAAGQYGAAREALLEAKSLLESRKDHRERSVLIDGVLSLVELREGNRDAARRLASAALDVSIDVYGEDHFHTADAYTRLAHVELESQHYELARSLLARSIAIEDVTEADRGEATFLLARATLEDPEAAPSQHARALELARAAESALTGKPAYGIVFAEVTAWLRQHDPAR